MKTIYIALGTNDKDEQGSILLQGIGSIRKITCYQTGCNGSGNTTVVLNFVFWLFRESLRKRKELNLSSLALCEIDKNFEDEEYSNQHSLLEAVLNLFRKIKSGDCCLIAVTPVILRKIIESFGYVSSYVPNLKAIELMQKGDNITLNAIAD